MQNPCWWEGIGRQKSCYFWFTGEVLQCRRSNSDVLEVNAKIHLWLPAGQGIIPHCLWLIHPLFGHRFIHHSEPSPFLILEGPETPHSSISVLPLMKFWGAHTKDQGVVILVFQLWKPRKAKWCTRGHTPVSEAKVGSPCPLFLPSLSRKPKEQ